MKDLNDFEQDFIENIMENSDGSEKRIGDFIIKNDYGKTAYYIGAGGDVVIPEEVGSASMLHTFSNAKNINSLTYPSCIKQIGAKVSESGHFGSKDTLEKLVFSEGLERIYGASCFVNYKKLKEVILPDSLEYLGTSAFKGTPWYKESLEVEEGCHYLGRFLVSSDKDIVHASVREGTTMICGFAFKARKDLVSITIPNTVKIIGEFAFNGCTSLKELHLPESVKVVEDSCFSGCASLTYFEAVNPAISISSNAFGSKRSEEIYYPEYAYIPTEIVGEGIEKQIFSFCYLTCRERHTEEMQKKNDAIVKKMKSKMIDIVINQENVFALRNIAHLAITKDNIDSLIELVQRKGNTEITAFMLDWKSKNGCTTTSDKPRTLTQVELKKQWGTKKLPDGTLATIAYKGRDQRVEIPNHLGKQMISVISEFTFDGCSYKGNDVFKKNDPDRVAVIKQIHTVIIPEGVKKIDFYAFRNCDALKLIYMPLSLTKIVDFQYAFSDCPVFTIYAPKGSYAEQYAKENDLPFEITE